MSDKIVLLSTAYAPPIEYIALLLNNTCVIAENERFVKQTYRNRCKILAANGVLDLSIPIKDRKNYSNSHELEIDYSQNWQKTHWKALESAYKNSPYYDYFVDELITFYEIKTTSLVDFNYELLCRLLKIARIKPVIERSQEQMVITEQVSDLRSKISPKEESHYLSKKYTQVFSDKFEFQPNLSFFDLLFNWGPDCIKYL